MFFFVVVLVVGVFVVISHLHEADKNMKNKLLKLTTGLVLEMMRNLRQSST